MSLTQILLEDSPITQGRKKFATTKGHNIDYYIDPTDQDYVGGIKEDMINALNDPTTRFSVNADLDNIFLPENIILLYDINNFVKSQVTRERNDLVVKGYIKNNNLYVTHYMEVAFFYLDRGQRNLEVVEIDPHEVSRYSNINWVPFEQSNTEIKR